MASDSDAVIIETVKLAEDRSGDVIVRLYEARGSRASAGIRFGFPHRSVIETDLLERETAQAAVVATEYSVVRLSPHPFQLVTLRVARA